MLRMMRDELATLIVITRWCVAELEHFKTSSSLVRLEYPSVTKGSRGLDHAAAAVEVSRKLTPSLQPSKALLRYMNKDRSSKKECSKKSTDIADGFGKEWG
jgi:hypothetical protein